MKNKKIVITGGPGTGKSSVIKNLEQSGYHCLHEVSREVILEAQKEGITQLFLEDPLLFSQKILEARINQFQSLKDTKEQLTFLDRGVPDVVAYLEYFKTDYPKSFNEACRDNCYNGIFLLPPWQDIYANDNERYETYEEAEKIYHYLKATYTQFGYHIMEVPKLSVEERCTFILNNLDA